ncbi:MAG: hypothetical protein WC375_10480, partial [Methanomassiliicoccales archaeon]
PLGGGYDDHFFVISGRKVCRGCLTVYPSALVAFTVLVLLGVEDFYLLYETALALFLVNFLRMVFHRSKMTNVLFNVMLGTVLALTVQALLHCPDDAKLFFYPFTLISAAMFMGLRGMRLFSKCKKCPEYHRYPKCFAGK